MLATVFVADAGGANAKDKEEGAEKEEAGGVVRGSFDSDAAASLYVSFVRNRTSSTNDRHSSIV